MVKQSEVYFNGVIAGESPALPGYLVKEATLPPFAERQLKKVLD
jgi:hypothetical protein